MGAHALRERELFRVAARGARAGGLGRRSAGGDHEDAGRRCHAIESDAVRGTVSFFNFQSCPSIGASLRGVLVSSTGEGRSYDQQPVGVARTIDNRTV